MKAQKDNRIFRTIYYLTKLLLLVHICFILFNIFANYTPPLNDNSKFTIRGDISVIKKDLKREEVKNLNPSSNPDFIIFHKAGFVRFDFDNWSDVLSTYSVLHIFFFNLWLFMGLHISLQLYKIFRALAKSNIFEKVITKRLRLIAATIILMPITKHLSEIFFLQLAKTNFSFADHYLSIPQNHNTFYGFSIPTIPNGWLIDSRNSRNLQRRDAFTI